MNKLEQALFRDGQAIDVERVEIEPLENGSFRWKLWAEGELVYCAVGQRSELATMLDATKIILQAMSGIDHEEITEQRPTIQRVSRRQLRRPDRSNHSRNS